jgi:hypothetical protein
MIVALACLLMTSMLVFAALLGWAIILRRRLDGRPQVFPCTVRVLRGTVPRLPDHNGGRVCRAEWTHDVLLLHRGVFLSSAQPLAVRIAEDNIEPAGSAQDRRLGAGAVQLRLRLDDDAVIAVASPAWARERLAGPFLAIAAHELPPDVSKQRPRNERWPESPT